MSRFAIPSREDAWNLNRNEKMCVVYLTNVLSMLEFAKEDLKSRLEKIEGGEQGLEELTKGGLKLLEEVRKTIPERQRLSLMHTATDYEMRLVPKYTPQKDAVLISKKEMKELVNAAQAKCRDCIDDSDDAKKCGLYMLLCDILPLEKYEDRGLCPYNMSTWEN